MKELKGLIRVIIIFGWINIIMGAMTLFAIITNPGFLNFRSILVMILIFLSGIIYLSIASGLSKRKKWAWYVGSVVFVYSVIHNFILGSMMNIIAGCIALALFVTLLWEKKSIFEQTTKLPNNIS